MARYSKLEVLASFASCGVVPVFYHSDPEKAKAVLKACADGGVKMFEFTNRGDFAHEVFRELVKYASESLPGVIVGAGSVVDPATAALYIQLGADFIVGPLFNPEVARLCNRRGVTYVPGCGTVSEIGFAQEAGCEICKVFPGDVLGPAFVKGVMAPMPWTRIMVTGGVKPEEANLSAWFKAGATCVGMGSNLFPADAVSSCDWERITRLCSGALALAAKVRG